MTNKNLSYGVFTNFGTANWEAEEFDKTDPWTGKFYVDVAKILERGNLDFIFFADNLMVPDTYGASMEASLRLATLAPQNDPAPLAALIGASTEHIGAVITMSTLAYHPYSLARLCSTLDHMCGGRFGWNIVTSTERGAARNYGFDDLPPRSARYLIADEYMDAVNSLLNSWEPGAVVMDRATGAYADYRKVHPVNFEGRYYRTAGPLNTTPSPQQRPVCFQAGTSPEGMAFATKHADCVIAATNGMEAMKDYKNKIREKCESIGRDPESIKVFFLLMPIIGKSTEDARSKLSELRASSNAVERNSAFTSAISGIDFATLDLDSIKPELETQGGSGALKKMLGGDPNATLREVLYNANSSSVELVGTASEIADRMVEVVDQVQPDGFLFTPPYQRMTKDYVRQLAEELAPELQKRGIMSPVPKMGTLKQKLGLN
jgi:FMN-dependent oxidoreductase (nitrilotriacetate monooxygenase family)